MTFIKKLSFINSAILIFTIFLSFSLISCGGSGSGGKTDTLNPPGNVKASQGEFLDKIEISWEIVTNAISYSISRTVSGTSNWQTLGTSNVNSFTDTNVSPGEKYDYKVTASSETLVSEASQAFLGNTAMTVPANIDATDTKTTEITVTWDAVDGASSYAIYRSTIADSGFTKVSTSTSADFNDSADQGVVYYYKVAAISSYAIESDLSDADEGIQILEYPTNLVATNGTHFSVIKLTWSAAANATSYEIYRDSTLIDTVSTTNYSDNTGLSAGLTYSYTVKARIDNGFTSAFSNTSSGSLRNSSNEINYSLSWTANRDSAVNQSNGGYTVFYSITSGFNPGDAGVTEIDVPYVSGDSAPTTYTISITEAATYYAKIRAYGEIHSTTRMSALSSEISFIIE